MRHDRPAVEWPTLLLLIATYGVWLVGTSAVFSLSPVLATLITGIAIAQHSSLQHEALHGHPFRNATLNAALVMPGLSLTVPYGRFRDTHLAHHHDPILTDPYDDPESNFLDPSVWHRMPDPLRAVLRFNNTVLGRMTVGPILGSLLWLRGEMALLLRGDPALWRDWALHGLGLVPVVGWLWVAAMPWWAYLVAAWIGHGLLKLRTYLEHRAHDSARARTVVVEDRGPLSILFLNNNFHVVHHMHPTVPWYDLPGIYARNRAHYLRRNNGYRYGSYWEILRRHFLTAKDPVPHPLWAGPGSLSGQTAEQGPVAGIVKERHARVVSPAE